ncbi:MAG: lytic transglycosylase domain-containing protein [Chloroflexota bacterium]
MTLPTSSQNVRGTPPSKPGLRPAGTKPATRRAAPQPTRGAQSTAFAQALTAAQATRRNAVTPLGAQQASAGGGLQLAQQQLSALQAMTQRTSPVPTAAPSAPAPRPTLDLPGGFGVIVDKAARKYGVDPALIAAVMQTESNFNPEAVSGAGARGLMQLMPATARGLGVTDPSDPLQAVLGGAKLLGQLLEKYNGRTDLALAAYNAGSGAVDKFGGIPPYDETRKYVPLVLSAYERFRQQAGR